MKLESPRDAQEEGLEWSLGRGAGREVQAAAHLHSPVRELEAATEQFILSLCWP